MARTPETRRRAESRPASSRLAAAIGRTIQVLRTDRGWSRKQFAARTGLSYSFLSEIENGVKQPSSRNFALIAGALDVAPGALLYDAERRLAEGGSQSEDGSFATPGRPTEAESPGAEPASSAASRRSLERFEADAGVAPSRRPSRDGARAPAATRDSEPRLERSRRVLDWLAGPLARRSAGELPPREAFRRAVTRTAGEELSQRLARRIELEPEAAEPGADELGALLDDLLSLLGELSPEDRERVLDLARRLAARGGTE